MPSDYQKIMKLGSSEEPPESEIAVLRKLYESYVKNGEIKPGQLVCWKSRLRPQWGMKYGQPAIVLRMSKEKCEACIGYVDPNNTYSISWTDTNRLEAFEKKSP